MDETQRRAASVDLLDSLSYDSRKPASKKKRELTEKGKLLLQGVPVIDIDEAAMAPEQVPDLQQVPEGSDASLDLPELPIEPVDEEEELPEGDASLDTFALPPKKKRSKANENAVEPINITGRF